MIYPLDFHGQRPATRQIKGESRSVMCDYEQGTKCHPNKKQA